MIKPRYTSSFIIRCRFDLQPGNLQEVLSEVRTVMAHKLAREDFAFKIDVPEDLRFAYDREVMIQVLINLMETASN